MIDYDVVKYAIRVANRVGATGAEYLDDTGYDPSTPCWEWKDASFWKGHGHVGVTTFDGRYVNVGAHRLAWMGLHGELPPDKPYITHGCDNPPCCRPSHLRPDSQKGNIAAMFERGRQGDTGHPGTANPSAKLSEDAVRRILAEPKRYGLVTSLAREYGVTTTTIQNVLRGKTWRHLDHR